MSAAVSNPPVRTESKSAKKKKAKSEASGKPLSVTSTTPVADIISTPHSTGETPNGVEGKDYESPYIQELYKSIRNINKKINSTAKVDSILAEHPNKSLDELVAERKINNDQKAQALKKPSLQASLSQLQEQVAQYKKFDQDYQARLNSEKAALKSSHEAELARVKDEAKKSATQEAVAEFKRVERQNTLLLSKFLRLAAAKRQEGEAETEDARALEGLLLMVYGGDAGAVSAAEKLIEGAAEAVLSTESQPLNYTYAQVKQAAMEHEPYQPAGESSMGDALQAYPSPPAAEHGDPLATTDPTIAHAGLNELSTSALPTNGVEASDSSMVPPQANIDAGAANEVAASHWDPKMSASAEDGWVEVNAAPRDPIETDNGVGATPAAMSGTQSWADEQPPAGPPTAMTPEVNTNGNDGFHEVHHSRGGRGRGGGQGEQRRGSFRGRGGYRGGEGGAYRGRGGFRGDRGGEAGHRGRGRGGFRGGRGRDGEHQRRSDES